MLVHVCFTSRLKANLPFWKQEGEEVSEESEDKDGEEPNDDDGLSMFCTPNFGDDDFDLNLLEPSKELQFSPHSGNHSNQTNLGFSSEPYWLPAQSSLYTGMDTAVTSHSGFTRDSILESLQSIAPQFPPQEDLDVPDISVTNSLNSQQQSFSQSILSTGISVAKMYKQNGSSSVIDKQPRQISPAPSTNSTVSPSKDSSEDSDDSVPLAQLAKRNISEDMTPAQVSTKAVKVAAAAKKARVPKKRKKKDPNEPQKPVSAYALFFRDTQAAIKGQNPNASFGEVSKIVASMWEGLDPETKNMYKKRTEMAKKEYLKQLAAYRASLVSQGPGDEHGHSPQRHSPMGASPQQMLAHMAENPMDVYNYNNVSPQHMGGPAQNVSPHHISSPHHMPSPQHIGNPAVPSTHINQHGSSPVYASSPHHIPSPQHMISPQHMASPQHIPSPQHLQNAQHVPSPQHMASPQHATSPQHIPSPQHPAAFTFNNVNQLVQGMGGYRSVGGGDQTMTDEPAVEQQLHPTIPTGRVFAGMCIRNGCTNRAIDNKGWDNEYCSNECVVSHCRDVFSAWVSSRQHLSMPTASSFPVK